MTIKYSDGQSATGAVHYINLDEEEDFDVDRGPHIAVPEDLQYSIRRFMSTFDRAEDWVRSVPFDLYGSSRTESTRDHMIALVSALIRK